MKSRTILLAAAFICCGMLAQAQIKPAFNPEKGEKYMYRQVADMNQSFSGQEMSNVVEILTEMNIKEKNNNEVTLDYTFKEIVATMSSLMMSFKVDTKNKAANTSDIEKMIATVYDCIIGKSLQLVVTPDGAIKSISGHDAIMEDVRKVVSSLSGMEQGMANGMVSQTFSEDAIKNSFEQLFKIYPDKEVKVGDSWSKDYTFEITGMSNNFKNTYTLKSVSNDIALLDVASVQTMKPGGGMEGEIKGEQKGQMRLNVKTGMIIQSSFEGSSKGNISGQGMDISMDITSKTTNTLQQ